MLAFVLSLVTLFMAPTGLAVATPAPDPAAARAKPQPAAASFDWMQGVWRTDALEMKCDATKSGLSCREEGTSAAMKGAVADLTFRTPIADQAGQLTVELPSIPASTFVQIARDDQGATFEMKTKVGIARLRFTRTGDELLVQRGNADSWSTTMTYKKG